MTKHTILFLAANPRGTDSHALADEARAMQVELQRSGFRDRFELVTRWAVEPLDLLRELRALKPTVVHFSGRDGQGGLLFQAPSGKTRIVAPSVIAETFGAAGASVKLVVLNACYSDAQADALVAHVDCVVGVSSATDDDAARSFAIGFYGGLGELESVQAAYKQGCAAISLETPRGSVRPQLMARAGIDASQLVLAAHPSPASAHAVSPTETAGPVEVHTTAVRTTSQPEISGAGPAAARPYDLFLAHPSAIKPSARALYDLLQPDLQVFLACSSLSPSDRRAQASAIATAQRASRATVLLISRQPDAAWYLGDEVLTAIALHRASPAAHRLVPVLLDPGIALPHYLGSIEAIDATAVDRLPGVAARLREQVAAWHRDGASWSAPPPEPASDRRTGSDHFRLYERLGRLSDTVFEQIVASAEIPRDSLAPRGAALATRVLDLAQLAALDPTLCRRVTAELERRAPWTRR